MQYLFDSIEDILQRLEMGFDFDSSLELYPGFFRDVASYFAEKELNLDYFLPMLNGVIHNLVNDHFSSKEFFVSHGGVEDAVRDTVNRLMFHRDIWASELIGDELMEREVLNLEAKKSDYSRIDRELDELSIDDEVGQQQYLLSEINEFYDRFEDSELYEKLLNKFQERSEGIIREQRGWSRVIVANKIPGGLADGKDYKKYNEEELAKGIKVELEHTDDVDIAKEIAMDHLEECNDYYTRLDKMESGCKKSSWSKVMKKAQISDWDRDEMYMDQHYSEQNSPESWERERFNKADHIDRIRAMSDEALQYTLTDLNKTIEVQEEMRREGMPVEKLGYYHDERHAILEEMLNRGLKPNKTSGRKNIKLAQVISNHLNGKQTEASKDVFAKISSKLQEAGYKAPFKVIAQMGTMEPENLETIVMDLKKIVKDRNVDPYNVEEVSRASNFIGYDMVEEVKDSNAFDSWQDFVKNYYTEDITDAETGEEFDFLPGTEIKMNETDFVMDTGLTVEKIIETPGLVRYIGRGSSLEDFNPNSKLESIKKVYGWGLVNDSLAKSSPRDYIYELYFTYDAHNGSGERWACTIGVSKDGKLVELISN